MSPRAAVAAVLAGLIATAVATAGDVAAGKTKYVLCAGCHGPAGAGNAALRYPPLAGLGEVYIRQQLGAFKRGQRDNASMRAMTAGLSDADMDNLAAYIATLR
jgi:cytochrome c553